MSRNIIEMPKVTTIGLVPVGGGSSVAGIEFHQPQIIQHLAFIPIRTVNVRQNLLEMIRLIEEFKLEQDIIIKEGGGSYDTAVYENKTDQTVIVPAATHLKGGKQNRGNNRTEVLNGGEGRRVDVNCFEPGRGGGTSRFTEFDDTPVDVAQETMVNIDGYDGSWELIRDYTALAEARSEALASFNDKTKEARAKYALNFETVVGQTGVAIVTRELVMVEVFPTPECFNIYAQRILRGKVASLFFKMHKRHPDELMLPSEVEQKVSEMLKTVGVMVDQTLQSGQKKDGIIIGRARKDRKVADIILTETNPPQIAYIFGVW